MDILKQLAQEVEMAFERFVPPKTAASRPRVTVRPSGLISFDANAVEAFSLQKATHAVLFFDRTRKIVGVLTTAKADDDGAVKLSRRRRSVSLKAPHFFDAYGLTIAEAQRFDVGFDESNEMVTINLKTIKRRRGRRPKKT
ncbi:MAG: hypothetical protein GY906_07045 [bacterium]|nr:hypothetical protein [bacterium]